MWVFAVISVYCACATLGALFYCGEAIHNNDPPNILFYTIAWPLGLLLGLAFVLKEFWVSLRKIVRGN